MKIKVDEDLPKSLVEMVREVGCSPAVILEKIVGKGISPAGERRGEDRP